MSQFDALFKTSAKDKTEVKPKADTSLPPGAEVAAFEKPAAAKTAAPIKSEKRVAGKSSNPDFTQVLTYVRRDTHNRVKAALIFDEQKRDLSDLVEELLAGWIENQK
jgi:hypothetical protein